MRHLGGPWRIGLLQLPLVDGKASPDSQAYLVHELSLASLAETAVRRDLQLDDLFTLCVMKVTLRKR